MYSMWCVLLYFVFDLVMLGSIQVICMYMVHWYLICTIYSRLFFGHLGTLCTARNIRTMCVSKVGTICSLLQYVCKCIRSNLSVGNSLRTAEKVHYIRVLTTSGCSVHQGVHYIKVHLQ